MASMRCSRNLGGMAARYARPSAVRVVRHALADVEPQHVGRAAMADLDDHHVLAVVLSKRDGGLREVRHLLHQRPCQLAHVERGEVGMPSASTPAPSAYSSRALECVRNPMRLSVCVSRETVGFARPVRRAIS